MSDILRHPAEVTYASELKALKASDDRPKPTGWAMSPQAVVTYLMGGTTADGTEIGAKYVGERRLIETRHRDARHRPGAPPPRGAGDREVVGLGAPRGGR